MRIILFTLLVTCFSSAMAVLQEQEVTYQSGDTLMRGYLVFDDNVTGKRPGVLVVHEWWGHNAYSRKRARMLAELGYVALAVDMYGQGKLVDHPKQASMLSSAVMSNLPQAKKRFLAAVDVLKKHPMTDSQRIAAIGYCFGGAVVLQMARDGLDLAAAVSFHGSLGTSSPATAGNIKAEILVAHGAADPFTTPEQLDTFKKEMADAGAVFQLRIYADAKHSFTNPEADSFGKRFNIPLEYNKAADEASWQDMKDLLNRVL